MEKKELTFKGNRLNGFMILFLQLIVLLAAAAACFYDYAMSISTTMDPMFVIIPGVLLAVLWFIAFAGYMKLEPNEARVMVFFGKYKGTFKETGFFWVNPFLTKKKLSLRARNLNIDPIKVNDKIGNPVLIGMVLVWKLKDTYKAMFDIDSQTMAAAGTANEKDGISIGNSVVAGRMNAFENFVRIQSDAALRQVAGQYAYDDNEGETGGLTLRSDGEEINEQLEHRLNERLAMAGLEVVEARINYLAYSPEIAAVMLRRQQASAIISAREKIVEGAVSMVQMALEKLDKDNVVRLDEDKKAVMVSNLLVVLCADESAQPVLNTGALNH